MACKIIHRPIDAPDLPKGVTLIGPTEELKDIVIFGQVKKSVKSQTDVFDNSRLLREVGVSLLLDHENIVKLKFLYMDAENYYLFFQHVDGGQLLDFIISHGVLNEKLSRKFLRQIISAVDYCHSNAIVHRDLKIENILLDKKGKLKLIDFGLANFINPYQHLGTFCGSLYFAAPEVLSAKKYIGPEVDLWSIGVVLYVLVTGRVPFDDSTLPALHRKIKAGIYDLPTGVTPGMFFSFYFLECLDLISKLLVIDPRKRASMDDLKRHPWVLKNSHGPPGGNTIVYPPVTLPLNSTVIRKMLGLGFGTEYEITKTLESYLNDGRSQGNQKWSIGGRSINCPESPLLCIYKLTLIKYGKLQPLQETPTLNHSALRKRSSTLGEKDAHRKSLWNLFGKNNTGSDETLNLEHTSKNEGKENETLRGVKTSSFMSKMFNRTKSLKTKSSSFESTDELGNDGADIGRQSIDVPKNSELYLPRTSIDVARNSAKMPSKSLDLRRDTSMNFDEPSSFFGTLRFGKIRSKTQMDLKNPGVKPSRVSRLVSPSMAAIKSFSSRIFSKKENNTPTQNMSGAATLDIKTSYLSGIFTIRNTTSLPLAEIRKELLKAFSRVPNMTLIEQKGYFFCKYFDSAPAKERRKIFNSLGRNGAKPKQLDDDTSLTLGENLEVCSKPKAQFEVFIRKIPFSSLHGIQFNKISGDAYKVNS